VVLEQKWRDSVQDIAVFIASICYRIVNFTSCDGYVPFRRKIFTVVFSTVEALQSELEAKRKAVKRYNRVDTDLLHKIMDMVSYAIFLMLLVIILDQVVAWSEKEFVKVPTRPPSVKLRR
jgi:hypothetical protein